MAIRFLGAVVCLLSLCIPAQLRAQRLLGVDWEKPSSEQEMLRELNRFNAMGISHLQVHQPLSSATWDQINTRGFIVWGLLPIRFAVPETFYGNRRLSKSSQELIAHFQQQATVHKLGLYFLGMEQRADFREALERFTDSLDIVPRLSPPYYITSDTIAHQNYAMRPILLTHAPPAQGSFDGFVYHPPPQTPFQLAAVKQFLEQTASHPGTPVFFDSQWLAQMDEQHPEFAIALASYAASPEPIFPLSQNDHSRLNSNSVIVVMLLLAWFTFGAIYSYNPVYRRSFLRYITGHTFFVNDVLQRHIRDLFTGISILAQHAIAGGIILYYLLHSFFQPLGFDALAYYYPVLGLFGGMEFGLFIWGLTITLLIQLVSVTWLWIANPAVKHLGQIINLYPWLLQLNLLIATLATAFFLSDSSVYPVVILTVLFFVLFLGSFYVTALDTIKIVRTKRHWVYAGTIGCYTIVLVGLCLWGLLSPRLQHVVTLAATLP